MITAYPEVEGILANIQEQHFVDEKDAIKHFQYVYGDKLQAVINEQAVKIIWQRRMHNQVLSIHDLFLRALELSSDPRGLLTTSQSSCLKMVEEVGEFAEAILIEDGLLPHKPKQKEPAMGEAADIILMVIQTLRTHYKTLNDETLLNDLQYHLGSKLAKWENSVLSFTNDNEGE